MRHLLASLAAVIMTSSAFAGDKIGNGGGLWACQKDEVFLSGVLVDLFEAREEFHYPVMRQPPGLDPKQIANAILQRLESEFPALMLDLRPHWNEVLANMVFTNAKIIEIHDSEPRIEPLPAYCPGGKWSYLQIANFKENGQLLIRQDIWNNPNLSPLDKAALLWHETVYRWLRMKDGDTTSSRSRQIVGLLFSTLPKERIEQELQEVLRGQMPKKAGLLCILDNLYTEMSYAGYGENELIARANAKQSCQVGEKPDGCAIDSSAVCEDMGDGTAHWTCAGTNAFNQRTYKADGRSELEARFKTELSCRSEVEPRYRIHCPHRMFLNCVKSN